MSLSQANRDSISAIALPTSDGDIQKSDRAIYVSRYSMDNPYATQGGALGYLITNGIREANEDDGIQEDLTPSELIDRALQKWDYDISSQLVRIFNEAYEEQGTFPTSPSATTKLTLKIEQYGFQVPASMTLADIVTPYVLIEGTLTDANGEIIWQDYARAGHFGLDDYEPRQLSEFLADPAYSIKGFNLALDEASIKLIEELED